YGLAVMGLAHPSHIKRNADAKAGDVLRLGKPLGVGVLSAALKKDILDQAGYQAMINATTKLNRPGAQLARLPGVHAITDVTGFGLLGHTLEMARASDLAAHLRVSDIPWLPGVHELARQGVITGASGRNWQSYGASIQLPAQLDDAMRGLLTDPQTSGGLLVACEPEAVEEVLSTFRSQGFSQAAVVGQFNPGDASVVVES